MASQPRRTKCKPSYIDLRRRLKLEGSWRAFNKLRRTLRDGGTSDGDSWIEAAARFSDDKETTVNYVSSPDLSVLGDRPSISMVACIEWVMENLDHSTVVPSDAPSAGAWGMRRWATSSLAARGDFYRTFASKLMPRSASDSPAVEKSEDAVVDDADARRMKELFDDAEG